LTGILLALRPIELMTDKPGFSSVYWSHISPNVLSALVETSEYAILCGKIALAHIIKVGLGFAGIDPEIIKLVSLMEKWVWIAGFAEFFIRCLIVMLFPNRRK